MALSTKTIGNLSKALTPEVLDYIQKDVRYAEFMFDIIPDAIKNCMGDIDSEVCFEISCYILDSIYVTEAK